MRSGRMLSVIGFVVFFCCLGCAPKPMYTPPSLTPPSAAQNTQQAPEVVYSYHFTMITPSQHNPLEFKSDTLQVRFIPRETVIEFTVYNLGEKPFTILWEQVLYIDPQGLPHPIIHKGVILSDTGRRQIPTMVTPQGVLNDTVAPVDYIYNSPSGWRQRPIFPKTKEALTLKGSTFGVVFPIKIQETVKSYTFLFQVADVEAGTVVK